MKDCNKIHPLLSLYMEEELSPSDQGRVDRHLKDCSDARKELEDYRALRKASRALPEPQAPADLHEKIMGRVTGKLRSLPSRRPIWANPAWGLAAAACVALFFLIQNPDLFKFSKPQTTSLSEEKAKIAPAANAPSKPQTLRSLGPQVREKESVKDEKTNPAPDLNFSYSPQAPEQFKDERLNRDLSGTSGYMPPPAAPPKAEAQQAEKKISKKRSLLYNSLTTSPGTAQTFSTDGGVIQQQLSKNLNAPQPAQSETLGLTPSTITGNYLAGAKQSLAYGLNRTGTASGALTLNPTMSVNDASTGTNGRYQNQTLGVEFSSPLPDILTPNAGDKTKPHFERLDVYQIQLDQYQLNWETNKVTKGKVVILDPSGNTLRAYAGEKQFSYYHQLRIDTSKLRPDFRVRLSVNDLNANEKVVSGYLMDLSKKVGPNNSTRNLLAQGASGLNGTKLSLESPPIRASVSSPTNPTNEIPNALGNLKETKPSIWTGGNGPSGTENSELITDSDTFNRDWQVFRPGQTAPAVDFTTQAVVYLTAGEEPTAGFSIHILNLEEKPDALVVHYQVQSPAPGVGEAQVLTRPWSLQVIPKPVKPVVFQKDP